MEHPLELVAVIDEAGLRRVVGNPRIHRAQLHHLVDAADLDSVTLQVPPASIGAHVAMVSPFDDLPYVWPVRSAAVVEADP